MRRWGPKTLLYEAFGLSEAGLLRALQSTRALQRFRVLAVRFHHSRVSLVLILSGFMLFYRVSIGLAKVLSGFEAAL